MRPDLMLAPATESRVTAAALWCPANVLFTCVWFGLALGLIEGWVLLGFYKLSRAAMWNNGVGLPILWVAPLVNATLFLAGGLVLAWVPWLTRRAASVLWPLLVGTLTAIGLFALLMSPRFLTVWSCAVMALGIGFQMFRWAQHNPAGLAGSMRRVFWWVVVAAVLGGIGGTAWAGWRERRALTALPPADPANPHVLLIILDTVRADHVGAYGYQRNTTPNLDRLAAEGVLFEHAYAAGPNSPSSHLALLTGERPGGDWYRRVMEGRFQHILAETLAHDGYAGFASSANNLWITPKMGFDRGMIRFDVYFHNMAHSITRTFCGKMLEQGIRWYGGYYDVAARKHADQVNAQLLNWLTRVEATGRPTFALLNYFDVHEPYFAPEPFRRRYSERVTRRNMLALYRGDGVPKPATPEELQLVIDAYDGSLAYLDHALGKLRAELERRALLDRTILIITADHGEEFNERGRVGHDSSNLRQEIVRVPLIVRYPARVPAGTRIARPVSLRQIPATVTSLLRLRQPSPYGHASLFAMGESEEPVLTEIGGSYAVIWSGWHLWVNRKGAVELYDIYADPAQRTNLAGRPETAEIQTRLREQLAKLAPESTRPPAAGPRYESDR